MFASGYINTGVLKYHIQDHIVHCDNDCNVYSVRHLHDYDYHFNFDVVTMMAMKASIAYDCDKYMLMQFFFIPIDNEGGYALSRI